MANDWHVMQLDCSDPEIAIISELSLILGLKISSKMTKFVSLPFEF